MPEPVSSPEFSHVVEVAHLRPLGETMTLTADPRERALIAARLDLVDLHELGGELTLEPWRKGGWRVTGTVHAEIEQQCVVTAEEFRSTTSFDLDRHFMHERDRLNTSPEIVVDPLSDDEPDVIADGRIDLGELAVEALALSLDPYPRMPGAAFEANQDDGAPDAAEAKPNPFAVLAKLQRPE